MNERDEGSGGDLIINVNLEDKDADDNATQRRDRVMLAEFCVCSGNEFVRPRCSMV